MLTLGHDIKLFQGIKLARQTLKVIHLFFADDAMLFLRSIENSCTHISGILDRFYRISGQQLNLAQSFIKFSPDTFLPQQQFLKKILRMPHVVELIGSWNGFLLSQAQKLVLINYVLVATVSHVMMSLEIPGSVANKIDSMIATFFWAKQGQKGWGGCTLKIGNGSNFIDSKEKWVHGRIHVFASHIRLSDARLWKVSHFIQSPKLRWNAARVRNSFEHKDANDILFVELSSCPSPDLLYWENHSTSNFTIKSGYDFLREMDIHQQPLSRLQ
ncbi:uncharacterized protein [Spinacia oleracea]|uniref:Reverse transcriptase domain-containing protein n=1 Tax=Spinacia oleracea TaxID=3562 RepID=A0ABM3QQG9_SPIOL|nr:uncharacterized protein LOC130461507 [Spinacia oleracea]